MYNVPNREQFMAYIQTSESLGSFIKEARKSQGLTQEQLAGLAGVGRRFVLELEAGKKSCHLDKTLAVISMLGCTLEILGKGR